ncbi:hypothetical protein [Sphingobacterium multivorum]|uniref:hypothetical protein n=1 Tax=Sphingobacterium multivorum TaxID=28454 RepID=UPI00301A9D54
MKRRSALVTLLVVGIAVIFSCSKDEKLPMASIIGKWEIKASINGFTGQRENFDKGNSKIVQFGVKDYYFMTGNNTTKKGLYSIERKLSKITGKEESYIIYDDVKDGVPQIYSVSSEELILSIDAMDGPTAIYRKID